ncbi:MerR family transcriptional regulator [Saccharothrix luteola]|uniref:MerR family transcriptional regulator n=1 Tax=Saccharothrix luteola TaxID=2893018 RepID=UPI001E550A2D|nr:MerR family transcriptional regulator [Saccharothrix luteola]MCC8249771.1 MerR family transcriptional regulator [Saccharothrix luteola]
MSDEELWTIGQLPDRVAALLADDYEGQRSGRVRELPNGRAIRWYTTIGLVDRPVAYRGRTALYGRRHLLQVVAVKKLQAAGHTLAEIQAVVVGADGGRLAELAGVTRQVEPAGRAEPAGRSDDGAAASRSGAFWRDRPASSPPAPPAAMPPAAPAPVASAPPAAGGTRVVPGLRLGPGVTLVLHAADRVPDATELAAIETAAAPLLDLLARTGLAPTTGEDNG